jgi:hypothetical protein
MGEISLQIIVIALFHQIRLKLEESQPPNGLLSMMTPIWPDWRTYEHGIAV